MSRDSEVDELVLHARETTSELLALLAELRMEIDRQRINLKEEGKL